MKTRNRFIYSVLLTSLFLSSCDKKVRHEAIPLPVPVKMELSSDDLVVGDVLDITFKVVSGENEKLVLNEDATIELKAVSSEGEVDQIVFENFPEKLMFPQGDSVLKVSVPVNTKGVGISRDVVISSFMRGYTITGQLQSVKIGDVRYAEISIKNNSEATVKEGQTFVLKAMVSSPVKSDVTFNVVAENPSAFANLPETLTIPAGQSFAESEPVTLVKSVSTNQDEDLVIKFTPSDTESKYPLKRKSLVVHKLDLHKNLDTRVRDERWLYEDADQLFVSPKNEAAVKSWGMTNYVVMNEGTPHPNSGNILPEGKWKFYKSYEFHHIKSTMTKAVSNDKTFTSEEYPLGFADQNTGAVETGGNVDNAKYSWVTNEGYLRMICLKEPTTSSNTNKKTTKNFGTSAFYANKFIRGNAMNPNYAAQNTRIYPGMRIETRARMRAMEWSGMLPGIWLQGNEQVNGDPTWYAWPDYGEIDVMENNSRHNNPAYRTAVEQTYHLGGATPAAGHKMNPTKAVTEIAGTIGDFHIFWFEWIDNETVAMGVNGVETNRLTKQMVEQRGARWPFTDRINQDGLYYILTMMFLHKAQPPRDQWPKFNYNYLVARNLLNENPAADVIPRMEIDWVRFYVDDTYSDHDRPFRKDLILY